VWGLSFNYTITSFEGDFKYLKGEKPVTREQIIVK